MTFKVFSTVRSEYANLAPLSLHLCCAPGSVFRNDRAAGYYFKSYQVILVCFDFSLLIEEDKINQVNTYIFKNILKYHDFHVDESDAIPPFICHVFTKKDRA